MSRIQLALNVTDLNAAISFYTELFGTPPAKVRPGYANFAMVDPPLKLVLIEGRSAGGTLNHLGVEVSSTDQVAAAHGRLAGAGLATALENQVTCCYAVQDKVWVNGPDAEPWEIYTVLADAEMPAGQLRLADADADADPDPGTDPGTGGTGGGGGACCSAPPAAETAACCSATPGGA